ncbi:MAG: multiheme c-type cytochrome [Candidatus Eisenbacteria bacterium]|nr:multiheme c-type cytochrome [Candidatus Eisenbacteria bacterium]
MAQYGAVLAVNGGDLVGRVPSERDKSTFLIQALKVMGYSVVTFGEREISLGLDYFLDKCGKAKIKVVNANTFYVKSKKAVVKPFTIEDVNGVKVGVTAVLGPDLAGRQLDEASPYEVRDPKAALEALVPAMRKKCDVVVVLSHLRTNLEAENIARSIKGIDVVLSSHDAGMVVNPTKAGDALLLRTGNRGQYLGKLVLTLDSRGKVSSYTGGVVNLDQKIPSSPGMTKLIDDFNASLVKASRASLVKEKKTAKLSPDKYLGNEICSRCHDVAGEQWAATRHAKAFVTLENAAKEHLPDCIKCHTTGYGEQGGFTGPGGTPDLRGVQCESCHGIGTKHEMNAAYGKISEATCRKCHNKEWSPKFDFKTYLKKISHGRKGDLTSLGGNSGSAAGR